MNLHYIFLPIFSHHFFKFNVTGLFEFWPTVKEIKKELGEKKSGKNVTYHARKGAK